MDDKRETKVMFEAPVSKKPPLPILSSDCLQHIFSFMPFENVSKLRQACEIFNETGKRVLKKGYEDIEKQLKERIEQAEERALFPAHSRLSYDMFHFLRDMHAAVNNCTTVYLRYLDVDNYFFVAGQVLDVANCLLKEFGSSSTLPYIVEHEYLQSSHPLLGPLIQLSNKARNHFKNNITRKFLFVEDEVYDRYRPAQIIKEKNFEIRKILDVIEINRVKRNIIKKQERKIICGKLVNQEFLNLTFKLNKNVVDLIRDVNEANTKVDQINVKVGLKDQVGNSCQKNLTMFKYLSPRIPRMVGTNEPNLATLPLSCIRNIVSHVSYQKTSQLRIVSKSFNEACKKELCQEFERIMDVLEYEIQYLEIKYSLWPSGDMIRFTRINLLKDLTALMSHCNNSFKWHMGSNYYFTAGDVLDEANRLYNNVRVFRNRHTDTPNNLDWDYVWRPNYILYHMIDLVHNAISRVNVVHKSTPVTKMKICLPDFIISGHVMSQSWKKRSQSKLEKIENLLSEQEMKINKQNEKNRKALIIISKIKNTIIVLNKRVSEINTMCEALK